MSKGKGIKVIITMIGLDSHTTGAEVVTTLLRDAGFEVVYLGTNQSPEMIVQAAIQEDVDVIGISSHASNFAVIERLMNVIEENGLSDVPVIVGGHVPPDQVERLTAKGVAKTFPPGTPGEDIIDALAEMGHARRAA